jgi:deoxyribose-phosphate aldolase
MDCKKLTRDQLAGMMDHTFLKAYATDADFIRLCDEARENKFAMVAINSAPVKLCKRLLEGSPVHVGAAISFPLGQTAIDTKAYETEKAINDGADEIDYVLNIGQLKMGNDEYIRREMRTLTELCHKNHVLIKVIFENCYLEKEEIERAAAIAKEIRPDFIKTSTGFGTSGADPEDVRRMKSIVGDEVKVKAAGGIRNWESCRKMLEAGAERIGTSNSIQICREFENTKI